MYLVGIDLGSSSVKLALVDAGSQEVVAASQYPETEMSMISHHPGWAEQEPETWWANVCHGMKALLQKSKVDPKDIKSVGIAYQMHGLVLVDKDQKVLRPSIIWCDSRAVEIGKQAFESLGGQACLPQLLNSPGNFTASKLKWVKDNEPQVFDQIQKLMLPGDFIAMKMTGEIRTTISGLSEGIFWDFENHELSKGVNDLYGFSDDLFPTISDTFEVQGLLNEKASEETGLPIGIPVSYRAGDQPNNALSLGVYEPSQVAATGGTSGVVYAVSDKLIYDNDSRINAFGHVNHSQAQKRIGLLLCINGAGIQYAWMKKQIADKNMGYNDMEELLNKVPVGSDGLRIIPFGNGAERMLKNQDTGARINNLQFNRHEQAHMFRAGLEGIAFSFVYGFQLLKNLGFEPNMIKVGNDNLFQSKTFSTTIANLMGTSIQIIDTLGAVGAAKGSGLGNGTYKSLDEAFEHNKIDQTFHPESDLEAYEHAYAQWKNDLEQIIK